MFMWRIVNDYNNTYQYNIIMEVLDGYLVINISHWLFQYNRLQFVVSSLSSNFPLMVHNCCREFRVCVLIWTTLS